MRPPYPRVKLRRKGQMTIPKAVRWETEIDEGDLVDITYNKKFGWIEICKVSSQDKEQR